MGIKANRNSTLRSLSTTSTWPVPPPLESRPWNSATGNKKITTLAVVMELELGYRMMDIERIIELSSYGDTKMLLNSSPAKLVSSYCCSYLWDVQAQTGAGLPLGTFRNTILRNC